MPSRVPVLAALGVPPRWDPAPLRRHHDRERRRRRGRLARLRSLPRPDFGASQLAAFFGDHGEATHLFRAAPLDWGFALTEPQATKGLQRFLEADASGRRTRAFLAALGATGSETISDLSVEAEAPTRNGGRIDLLLEWRDEDAPRAAAVEAKFGAAVSAGQLPDYRRELRERAADPLLVLLTPPAREKDRKRLRRNRDWRPLSWPVLLLRFERALAPGDPDPEFARFRRTLWDQAG